MMTNMQTMHTHIPTSFAKVLSVIGDGPFYETVSFTLYCGCLVGLFIEGFVVGNLVGYFVGTLLE